MRFAFPQWRGFEVAPEGNLLDQLVDLSGPMGIAHERSVGFFKDFHRHDRAMILLPRGSCVVRVKIPGGRVPHEVDDASLLIVPGGLEHEDEGRSAIFETFVLFPSASLLEHVADDEQIPRAQVGKFFGHCQKLPRTPPPHASARSFDTLPTGSSARQCRARIHKTISPFRHLPSARCPT